MPEISPSVEFALNTFALLVWGALVMWMSAGFTMLEAGSVRTKNASMICLKNVGIFSIAGIAYYLVGFNIMYDDVDSIAGSFRFLFISPDAEMMVLDGDDSGLDELLGLHSAPSAQWLFQMLFVATTASIVSGAILERVKLWAFWIFTAVMTAFIYPIVGAWTWGGGWLAELGFEDFAGGTVVHVVGGSAALAGVVVVGARRGKFRADGTVKATPPSNALIMTLGVMILWLGWFGFNAGSVGGSATPQNAVAMATVLVNTNLAAAAGMLAAVACARPLFGRVGLATSLNGALAGLVSVTAGPVFSEHWWSLILGGVGGVLCTVATRLMERVRLDDVVGAVPVHLVAGTWGTLASAVAAGTDFGAQALGTLSVVSFVFVVSALTWKVIDWVVGVRVNPEIEYLGQDAAELGIESHPEFVLVPEDREGY